jgi:hypothetical protein
VSVFPVDNEALLYDPVQGTIYHLNATAFLVWRCCDGRTVAELAQAVTAAFGADPATAEKHVQEVVDLLTLGGLLNEKGVNVPSA